MRVGEGEFTYEWIEHWARIPDTVSGKSNGRTHGAVALDSGPYANDVLIFSQAQPGVLRFGSEGNLKNAWGDRFGGAHGMTLAFDGDMPVLWLTDQDSGEVVKTTIDGRTLLNLQRPNIPVYQAGGKFVPTWVAVHEERIGGNGDIWVTDGYGSNFIHRYTKSGAYVTSINGTEGHAGAFACPHGITFIPKPTGAELYIADRSNQRVQVYDADGTFKRSFGNDFLNSPCGFVHRNGVVYIPELHSRLAILDHQDKLITYIGEYAAAVKSPGWPNLPAAQILPGKFNSPHGMAVDSSGNLYVAEWLIGGRVTKLARV